MRKPLWKDPIEIFIDRQLAAPWREHQLYKDIISKGVSWVWCPLNNAPLYINQTFSIINTIEDEIITALDKKYHGKRSRLDKEIELVMQGYHFIEIGDLLGISRRTVFNDLRVWSEKADAEEIKDKIRKIANSFGP